MPDATSCSTITREALSVIGRVDIFFISMICVLS
jgi:hypothetical protein